MNETIHQDANEQRPLLEQDRDEHYGATEANIEANINDNGETEGLSAKEPSTGRLLLVLGSGWIGVLFQALGM